MVNQIEQMLKEAWKKFCDYYDTMAPRYRSLCLSEYGTVGNDYWICWNESDLTFHIRRFLYEILNKYEPFSGIEIHSGVKLDAGHFNGYRVLQPLITQLNSNGEQPKQPEVDMIIARENKDEPFLLCAEAKCFRGTRFEKPIPDINNDIKKLRRIKNCGIAKSFVFILFDDYYWCHNANTANAIQQRLDEIRNKDGIIVLFHTSKAKLKDC